MIVLYFLCCRIIIQWCSNYCMHDTCIIDCSSLTTHVALIHKQFHSSGIVVLSSITFTTVPFLIYILLCYKDGSLLSSSLIKYRTTDLPLSIHYTAQNTDCFWDRKQIILTRIIVKILRLLKTFVAKTNFYTGT